MNFRTSIASFSSKSSEQRVCRMAHWVEEENPFLMSNGPSEKCKLDGLCPLPPLHLKVENKSEALLMDHMHIYKFPF